MEKVLTGSDISSLISATTAEESIPPERKAPRGTSDIRRTRTASRKTSTARSPASSSLILTFLLKSGSQYLSVRISPAFQRSQWPGSSFLMAR